MSTETHEEWQARRDAQINAYIAANRDDFFDTIRAAPISRRSRWLGIAADVGLGALMIAAVVLLCVAVVGAAITAVVKP